MISLELKGLVEFQKGPLISKTISQNNIGFKPFSVIFDLTYFCCEGQGVLDCINVFFTEDFLRGVKCDGEKMQTTRGVF